MRYLVTGATGFLGAHLVRVLEAHGHEVARFSRSTGNDVLDAGGVARAVRGCDGVFHCAGKVSRKPDDAEELYRLHVEGTRTLLDGCQRAGVPRVVVASSSGTVAVSSDPRHQGTERDPTPIDLVAKWPYYRAKLFAERVALGPRAGALEVICVNPSLLLGPGDINASSTGDVRMFLEGSIVAVPAGGLSFVDVRDAAEAMRLAMGRGRPGERYLVGGCNLTIRDLLRRLSGVSGVPGPWAALPRSPSLVRMGAGLVERAASRLGVPSPFDPVAVEMAQYFWYVDATKARTELGWSSREANVTLFDTVEDLRSRGVVWPRGN
ncbi:MAG TPA: NAD-dependent epimerase/dehydratase family protein [Polyangiaceae bacterium]|nr:NAD-dependent epimerase/dehydratase family protein [Polyangiaceae bacterium]